MPGVYVHIPFCESKCPYCDFYSITNGARFYNKYLDSLFKEFDYYLNASKNQEPIFSTLFIGGGTPTVLSAEQLYRLINGLLSNGDFQNNVEITVEVNPKTLTDEKVAALKEAGVNRISLGVQAFQDRILKRIGRLHTVSDVFQSVKILRKYQLQNFSFDLIFGLPKQSEQDWSDSLQQAVSLNPTHLSCYSLIIEEDTPFGLLKNQGKLVLPDEDSEYRMFVTTQEYLASNGYQHYEISNFAKEGYQCKHNLIYWKNKSYLGLGSGAYGYWEGVRYGNIEYIERYIESISLHGKPEYGYQEKLDVKTQMDETIMMGLRLISGISVAEFKERFNRDFRDVYRDSIEQMQQRGLVAFEQGCLKLTKDGIALGNLVFSAFLRDSLDK
ncbi:MAG: oxygen-independent coproporphyrinogen III oxidase [Firmicutes bacterium]|nr:oxygen-independent coproporphyrinogen III oxidase [Bacillota bacterium]